MIINSDIILNFVNNSEALMYTAAFSILFLTIAWYTVAKYLKPLKKSFIIFATLVQFAYIIWRIGYTLPWLSVAGTIVGLLLLGAEVLGFIQSLTYRVLFLKDTNRELKPLSALGYIPTVDIMITTYNEPSKVIKRTVAGAYKLDYPKDKYTIYVCDDGSRESIRDICEAYGAVWITRKVHNHAKAGNLNNCYQHHATGEFSVILDADMVPRRDFLQKTLGYFNEEKVAFVQTPQVFFNSDTFQRNLGFERKIPNEQDFFMEEVQAHRQEFNALLFVGSGCVFRRTHLESIGFIPTGTITEDMATSLLLQGKGYSGVLVTDTFAQGLSAESFADHVTQRSRWCQGNIQVLKQWHPWRMKGLTFMQKQIITDGVSYWYFGLKKMIFTLAPIFFILTGIPIFKANLLMMLVLWLPAFISSGFVMQLFSHRNRSWSWAHIYEMALAPYLAFAAILEMLSFGNKSFAVTPKGVKHNKTLFQFGLAVPHLILTALSILSLALIGMKIPVASIGMVIVYAINAGWILYNLFAIVVSIGLCFEKPRVREFDRLEVDQAIGLQYGRVQTMGRLINISEGGCNIAPYHMKDTQAMEGLKRVKIQIGNSIIPGRVVKVIPGKQSLAVQFDEMSSETYADLVDFIFSYQKSGYGELSKKSVFTSLIGVLMESGKRARARRRYGKQKTTDQNPAPAPEQAKAHNKAAQGA